MLNLVNLVRLGLTARRLRRHQHWRQSDVAHRATVSQQVVSQLERGMAGRMTLERIERVLHAVGADIELVVRWRGGAVDRVLDEGHAALLGQMAARLESDGWQTPPEVSYSEFGERGSIDVLAWRDTDRRLLIVEIKTELTSIEATLRKHDEKARLAPTIAAARLGSGTWQVMRLLVLPDTGATRRRVQNHCAVLDRAYPLRGHAARHWLRNGSSARVRGVAASPAPSPALGAPPASPALGALVFLPFTRPTSGRRRLAPPDRVRVPAARRVLG